MGLIIALVLVGIAAGNALSYVRGPEYQAEARVLLNPSELIALVTNSTQAYVDPERLEDRGLALAKSPDLYARAASRTGGRLGTGEELEDATAVSAPDDDILTFKATTDDPDRSKDIADAVSLAYIAWRRELSGSEIEQALTELRAKLRSGGLTPTRRAALEDRLSEFELLESLNTGNARRIESATSATKTSPAPVRDSVLGAAIGLTIALLLVGLREAFDTKVRSEEDVEELLNVPVLATVQGLPRRASIVMFGRHEHEYGDSYALLAANLAQAQKGRRTSTLLAVTSSIAGEGKTSTAANLAIALARRQEDVILADFDVRNPSLAEVFRLPPRQGPGLSHLILGEAALEETLWEVSLDGSPRATPASEDGRSNGRPGTGSLRLLPAGGPFRTTSIAESPRLSDVLAELQGAAEFIVLDTPPALLTVEMAELSRSVDLVLIVVRQGRVTRRSLGALGRQLQNWPAQVAGAFLTDVPVSEKAYPYYARRH